MAEDRSARTEQIALLLLQQIVLERARKDFSQAVLCDDMVNRLSLKYISSSEDQNDLGTWVAHHYPKEVENCFAELYKYCLHYALKLISDNEKAEDIAQDCLKELLSTNCNVSNLKAWLCRVTHNKAIANIKQQNYQKKLLNSVQNRCLEPPPHPDEDDLSQKLSPDLLKKLLSKSDYQTFCELKKTGNLKAYAAKMGISYQTAKEHKHRLKLNLRSAYLKEQGWKDSQAILSYHQLRSIKRFIGKLVENGGKACHCKTPDLQETLKDCTGLMTWEIKMMAENYFHLFLMFETPDLPSVMTMDIKLNRANRISIVHFKRGTLVAVMPEGTAKPLSVEKGKAILNYSELLKLVPQATVYDQELFKDMLEELK